MTYSKEEILKFYRILALEILRFEKLYGFGNLHPDLRAALEKLHKLANEIGVKESS